ncbi:MAG: hypothetical protein UHS41_01845 [Lachnospiraceae bacterium]|nr:hypothetical protein [Lachnospiraceae bacterium]
MSFTGIFKAKDGLVAIADSKATIKSDGKFIEDVGRNPEKLFPFVNGVAVIYGANQILVQNQARLFSQKTNVEDLIYEYLNGKHTLDSNFFQGLLLKMSSNPANQEPIHFIVGHRIWEGKYRIEHHQIGYNYYLQRLIPDNENYFTGGEELYKLAFNQMDSLSRITSVDILQKYAAEKLEELIAFYDKTLAYNPVGGIVKSYILR